MFSKDDVANNLTLIRPDWFGESVKDSYLDPKSNGDRIGEVCSHLALFESREVLEEYVDRLINLKNLSKVNGRGLVSTAIGANLQLDLVRILKRFPWEVDSHSKGFPLLGMAEREARKHNVDPEPIFNLLIEHGELKFASMYGDKFLSNEHQQRVRDAISQTYKDLVSSRCFDRVMSAISEALPKGVTMGHLADEGLFDEDNQAAYKRWLLNQDNEPGKPYSRSPKRI